MEQEITGGYLTPEIINAALDELWNKTLIPYDLPWQDRHGEIRSPRSIHGGLIYPRTWFPPILLGVPELDWAVTASGWKLVIENGAMKGIVRQ